MDLLQKAVHAITAHLLGTLGFLATINVFSTVENSRRGQHEMSAYLTDPLGLLSKNERCIHSASHGQVLKGLCDARQQSWLLLLRRSARC